MPQDYSSTKHQDDSDIEQNQQSPQQEGSSSSSSPLKKSGGNVPAFLDPAIKWVSQAIGTSKGEYAPLINRGKGTLELPRQTKRKVIVTITAIVSAIVIFGGIVVWSVANSGEPEHKGKKEQKKKTREKKTLYSYLIFIMIIFTLLY